jgi:hypothetical protein
LHVIGANNEDVAEPDWVLQPVCGHWNWSHGQFFVTGRILALCDPGGCNPVLGRAVAFAPYPTVVKSLIDRLSSPGAPGALAFRLVSASAGCPVQ